MRIVHLSDIHLWRYCFNPIRLLNKRAVGIASLLAGRARRFRLERLHDVVERVLRLDADHVLITGDLTTTALTAEFHDALDALAPLLRDPERVTVIPGNHDRYTCASVRGRSFERAFGAFMPREVFPWIRRLDAETSILGLDPTRAHLSATGRLPLRQLAEAKALLSENRSKRLIVACHYPIDAPDSYKHELAKKRLINAGDLADWLRTIGPHVYCCGHVHAAWAHQPEGWPEHLCLNSGAPLLRDKTGHRPPGFLEITLDGPDVSVTHHAWQDERWTTRELCQKPAFFSSIG